MREPGRPVPPQRLLIKIAKTIAAIVGHMRERSFREVKASRDAVLGEGG